MDAQTDLSLRWVHWPHCWFCRAAAHYYYYILKSSLNFALCIINWATTWQNQQNDICAQRRLRSAWAICPIWSVFAVRMKKLWVLSYPLSAQRRLWSDRVDCWLVLSCRGSTVFGLFKNLAFASRLSHSMTKPTKRHLHPAKTHISLGIRLVWSEPSLSAWRNRGSLAIHWVHSENSESLLDAQVIFCFFHAAAQYYGWTQWKSSDHQHQRPQL